MSLSPDRSHAAERIRRRCCARRFSEFLQVFLSQEEPDERTVEQARKVRRPRSPPRLPAAAPALAARCSAVIAACPRARLTPALPRVHS